jgi:uncharacterized protein (DUF1684 family)
MRGTVLDLLDYRRRVGEMYQFIRERGTDSVEAQSRFRSVRDELFKFHPQSPLDDDQKKAFTGLCYYSYDVGFRVVAQVDTDVEQRTYDIDLGDDGGFRIRQFAQVAVELPTGSGVVALFWIDAYGGGVFLPFRDATNGAETYGGGRYLYDTIKGADLGTCDGQIVLDFNYAYHPSCAYNARWVCPLAPPQNTLEYPVPAGEMLLSY